jgi:U2-associated protein SR140
MFIRTVAAEVRGHDAKYEANLKEREKNNPKFGFLVNKHVRAPFALVRVLSYRVY